MLISVIVTIRNEEHHIRGLLDSLVAQEGPLEVIVVDAFSTDASRSIVGRYATEHPFVRLHLKGGTRGEGRNFGIERAAGGAVAFIDGDCVASPDWLKEIRRDLSAGRDIVAGRTVRMGRPQFANLSRVELFYQGVDLTFPSCNLAYRTGVVKEAGAFDTLFRTAEDIDLNYRAVKNGHRIHYNENAVVNHHERDTLAAFLKQAFWNGYGRKQLTLKHGRLWSNYSVSNMIKHDISFWYLVRTAVALLGYATAKMRERKEDYRGTD
ncbi:MAG: glycosyltransferase [Euryarchaeota archaeon]|nr:glycosyltransferase [Euryarchaeota archaeon]